MQMVRQDLLVIHCLHWERRLQFRFVYLILHQSLKLFTATHTYESITVGGSKFRYVLSGKKDSKTLVLLNGGMNTLEMWMGHIRNESEEQVAYAQEMFETIFKDYTKEKDVHISGLLADLMNQRAVTESDFKELERKILLILPNQDLFSGKMQKNLIELMHNPEIKYVSGGHLSTILKANDYVQAIRSFLQKNIS